MATPSSPLTLYLSYSTPIFSLTMWSPHCYIPSCGQSLRIICSAAEGITEGCILRVLLLTLCLLYYCNISERSTKNENDLSSGALTAVNYILRKIYFHFKLLMKFNSDCVRSTRSTHEYRAPLVYIESIAELEAVDTAPI